MAPILCRLCLNDEDEVLDLFHPKLTNSAQLCMLILLCTGVNSEKWNFGKSRLIERFEWRNCVCKGKSTGRPSILTDDVVGDIQHRLEQSRTKSLRKLSAQTGVSCASCQKEAIQSEITNITPEQFQLIHLKIKNVELTFVSKTRILPEERHTKYVCHCCCNIVVKFYQFRKNALSNDKALKVYFNQVYTKRMRNTEDIVELNNSILEKIDYPHTFTATNPTKSKSIINTTKNLAVDPSVCTLFKRYPNITLPNELLKVHLLPNVVLKHIDAPAQDQHFIENEQAMGSVNESKNFRKRRRLSVENCTTVRNLLQICFDGSSRRHDVEIVRSDRQQQWVEMPTKSNKIIKLQWEELPRTTDETRNHQQDDDSEKLVENEKRVQITNKESFKEDEAKRQQLVETSTKMNTSKPKDNPGKLKENKTHQIEVSRKCVEDKVLRQVEIMSNSKEIKQISEDYKTQKIDILEKSAENVHHLVKVPTKSTAPKSVIEQENLGKRKRLSVESVVACKNSINYDRLTSNNDHHKATTKNCITEQLPRVTSELECSIADSLKENFYREGRELTISYVSGTNPVNEQSPNRIHPKIRQKENHEDCRSDKENSILKTTEKPQEPQKCCRSINYSENNWSHSNEDQSVSEELSSSVVNGSGVSSDNSECVSDADSNNCHEVLKRTCLGPVKLNAKTKNWEQEVCVPIFNGYKDNEDLWETVDEKLAFTCDVCNKVFDHETKLKLHRRAHNKCDICKALFRTNDALSQHLKNSCYKRIIENQPILCLTRCDESTRKHNLYEDLTSGDKIPVEILCVSDDNDIVLQEKFVVTSKEEEEIFKMIERYQNNKETIIENNQEEVDGTGNILVENNIDQVTIKDMYSSLKSYRVPAEFIVDDTLSARTRPSKHPEKIQKEQLSMSNTTSWVSVPLRNFRKTVPVPKVQTKNITMISSTKKVKLAFDSAKRTSEHIKSATTPGKHVIQDDPNMPTIANGAHTCSLSRPPLLDGIFTSDKVPIVKNNKNQNQNIQHNSKPLRKLAPATNKGSVILPASGNIPPNQSMPQANEGQTSVTYKTNGNRAQFLVPTPVPQSYPVPLQSVSNPVYLQTTNLTHPLIVQPPSYTLSLVQNGYVPPTGQHQIQDGAQRQSHIMYTQPLPPYHPIPNQMQLMQIQQNAVIHQCQQPLPLQAHLNPLVHGATQWKDVQTTSQQGPNQPQQNFMQSPSVGGIPNVATPKQFNPLYATINILRNEEFPTQRRQCRSASLNQVRSTQSQNSIAQHQQQQESGDANAYLRVKTPWELNKF